MLTGNKDLDKIILNKLDDVDLVKMCQVNKLANELCTNQVFWLNRIQTKFPIDSDILNKYKGDRTWSEYYIDDLRLITPTTARVYLNKGATTGRLDLVIIALNNGLDVRYVTDEAVRIAIRYGNLDILKYLVTRGSLDIQQEHNLALRIGSYYGHLDIVKYLVDLGADIHANNEEALRVASSNGHIDIVKYLVDLGANIHANNDEAVNLANRYGYHDVVKYLVSLGSPQPEPVLF